MVPPDGARIKRIPALSWDPVVTPTGPDVTDIGANDDDRADVGRAGAATDDPNAPSIAFEPMRLATPSAATPSAATSPAATPPAATPHFPTPVPASAPLAQETIEPAVVETTVVEEPVTVRTTPPAVIVPAIGDVTSGPDLLAPAETPASAPSPAEPATDVLPTIQEATPVVATGGPMLPSVAPAIQRPAAAAAYEFDPTPYSPAPTTQPTTQPATQPRHRSKGPGRGSGLKLVATLVVLGGLVAAGVVFGQPYLFPGESDGATAPYVDAVEAARGVAFAEPVAIVAESTSDFTTRLGAHLAPTSPEELSRWRAFGLASGTVDDATLAGQLAGWQDTLYSGDDGQVYRDLGVEGAVLDAQLVQAMTAASLDQEFGWSAEQPQRTLDAAAATSAEVLRQSRAVQQSSPFDAEVPPVASERAGALPPVIGYRMLAPHVFAEFDATIEPTDRTNPLTDLGTVTTSPTESDRSFWYLVFAGYLDARTSYAASEAVVESALTGAERGATQCASATFSGGGVEQTATLRSALEAWAVSTPAEMSSSFQVLPDGTLQLVSCDPGVGFDVAARPDVARELLAWRTAELATMEAVRVGGGGEAELVDAWAFVQASPVAIDLMALPPATTPSELAATAQNAVNALFTPAG